MASTTKAKPRRVGKQGLQGHVIPKFSRSPFVSRLDPTTRLNLAFCLPFKNPKKLDAFVKQVSNPASERFRQYLTPAQFRQKFGPAEQDYQELMFYCERTEGLTITAKHRNSGVIAVAGTAFSIEKALQIKLSNRLRPDGTVFYSPNKEPSPKLAMPELHISGLDNYVPPRAQTGSGPGGAYGGSDFRNAYAPGVTLTGQGQMVGLYETNGFFVADIEAYKQEFGLKVPYDVITLDGFSQSATQSGPNGSPGGTTSEISLDIEVVMAMAPGLEKVVVYEGSVLDHILVAMADPETHPLCAQLSASYTASTSSKSQNYVNQMAAQGQTFFVAAGDGRALCPGEGVNDLRGLSNLTVVGGTSLAMNGAGASWAGEYATSNGGGVIPGIPIPNYQAGIATPANGGSNQWRMVPDVSAVAGGAFIIFSILNTLNIPVALVGGTGLIPVNFWINSVPQGGWGGTSLSTPLWAAYMALVNELLRSGNPQVEPYPSPGYSVGFVNPTLYLIYQNPQAYANDFHDITNGGPGSTAPGPGAFGTNANGKPKPPCKGYIGYAATLGYDLATGLGSPNAGLIDDIVWPPYPTSGGGGGGAPYVPPQPGRRSPPKR